MKYKVQAVIFDFDGVIIDSGLDIANAVKHTLKRFSRPVLTTDEIISYTGHGSEFLIRKSFQDCSDDLIMQALPAYNKYYLENALIETRLYPHVKETLGLLKGHPGYKIALVTNKPEDIAYRILAGLDIEDYFDAILGPESVKNMKPDPEGIRQVLAAFQITPNNAVMVGDSHTDIEAGRNAGTYTCGVSYGLGNTEELIQSGPDFIINDMSQLLEHLV